MSRFRTAAEVEADLSALRMAAERAGTALACLFSSSEEYEADLIRVRRAAGAYGNPPARRLITRSVWATLGLTLIFLML